MISQPVRAVRIPIIERWRPINVFAKMDSLTMVLMPTVLHVLINALNVLELRIIVLNVLWTRIENFKILLNALVIQDMFKQT